MSWASCFSCGAYINTDDDPASAQELNSGRTVHLCEGCRDEYEAERAIYDAADGMNDERWLEARA